MADTTISQLSQGIPGISSSIPFSDGGDTKQVAPGKILANAGNVGIGIGAGTPNRKLHIFGSHGDTMQRLQSTGGSETGIRGPANLLLWASEPGYTFTGCGVGANVAGNDSGFDMFRRIDATNGQSYIRFIPSDGTMRFYTGLGDAPQGMIIDSNGNVGIGMAPSNKLDVNGTIKATGLQVPGTVVQVICNVKSDISATNSTSFIDIPGLSASITPKSVLNKVLFTGNVFGSSNNNAFVRIMRSIGGGAYSQVYTNTGSIGSRTPVSFGDFFMVGSPGNGAGKQNTSVFLDTTNTTAEVIYKLQYATIASGSTMSINCTYYNTDANYSAVGASSITLMEIAG
jgi:hypothetical protein